MKSYKFFFVAYLLLLSVFIYQVIEWHKTYNELERLIEERKGTQ